jgi:hypothetical protein
MVLVIESSVFLYRVALGRHALNLDPSIRRIINRAWEAPPRRKT